MTVSQYLAVREMWAGVPTFWNVTYIAHTVLTCTQAVQVVGREVDWLDPGSAWGLVKGPPPL